MILTNVGQSEGLDIDTDGSDVDIVTVGEEANDAAVVLDRDMEGLGILEILTISIRTICLEVGDDGEVGYAISPMNVLAVHPVNFCHELIWTKSDRGGRPAIAAPLACGVLQPMAILVGEGKSIDYKPMADGDTLQEQRRYRDVAVSLGR